MSINLQVAINRIFPDSVIDCLMSSTIELEVTNLTSQDITLDHQEAEIYLELYDANSQERVLLVNDKLKQKMLFSFNLAEPSEPIQIEANQTKIVNMDLAEYYYPLASGQYFLVPCVRYQNKIIMRGEEKPIKIVPAAMIQGIYWFENAIFGTQNLLTVSTIDNSTSRIDMRWLGLNQPLASFLNKSVAKVQGFKSVVPALPAFWDVEDFEPAFERVLVIKTDQEITIIKLHQGEVVEQYNIPSDQMKGELVDSAIRRENGEVCFFIKSEMNERGKLEAYTAVGEGTVRLLFSLSLADKVAPVAVYASADYIQIFHFDKSLIKTTFNNDGQQLSSNVISKSFGRLVNLKIDRSQKEVRAVFEDYNDPQKLSVEQSNISLLEERPTAPLISGLVFPREFYGDLVEIDFLFDKRKRLHVLRSGSNSLLVYMDPDRNVVKIAKGTKNYFPRLLAGDLESHRPFAGFFQTHIGYRFFKTGPKEVWRNIRKLAV